MRLDATYLGHHAVCAGLFVVSELYIWVPILHQALEAPVFAPDGSLGPAARSERILLHAWDVLALDQRRVLAQHPAPAAGSAWPASVNQVDAESQLD